MDQPTEHEFEVWQDGAPVAIASSTDREQAIREIRHYAAQYGQDGPVEIKEVIRRPLDADVSSAVDAGPREIDLRAWDIINSPNLRDVLASGARGTTTAGKKALAAHYLRRIEDLQRQAADLRAKGGENV